MEGYWEMSICHKTVLLLCLFLFLKQDLTVQEVIDLDMDQFTWLVLTFVIVNFFL